MAQLIFVFLTSLIVSFSVFAEDNSSTAHLDINSVQLKKADLPSSDQEAKRKDIDEEITNPRLRAVSGAKSLWSIQSRFDYRGGSVEQPLSKERPVLSPGKAIESDVKMTGQVSVKYRATDHNSFNLGIGVGWLTPGHAGQKGQSEDPYLGYAHVERFGDVQNINNMMIQKYTADSAVLQKLNFDTYFDDIALVNLGSSRWQLGGVLLWQRNFYTKEVGGMQDMVGLCPFAEYAITDHLAFRTVSNVMNYYNTQGEPSTFIHDSATQSAGFGIAITRDIYLYPNVQWVWEDIRSDKTNVALQTNINL